MDYSSYFEFENLIEGIDGEPGEGIHGDGGEGEHGGGICETDPDACDGGGGPPPPPSDGDGGGGGPPPPSSDDTPESPEQKEKDEEAKDPSLRKRAYDAVKNIMKNNKKGIAMMFLALLIGFLFHSGFVDLVSHNIQSKDECICNFNRTKELCTATPPAPYTPSSCQGCDTGSPKQCCKTCKDALNVDMFLGLVNLSFLGTTDILDLSNECKSETADACCDNQDVRDKRASDLVTSCLFSKLEALLPYLYVIGGIILLITLGPSVIRIFKMFGGKHKGSFNIIVPVICFVIIITLIYSSKDVDPSNYGFILAGVFFFFMTSIISSYINVKSISSQNVSYTGMPSMPSMPGMPGMPGMPSMQLSESSTSIFVYLFIICLLGIIVITVLCVTSDVISKPCTNQNKSLTKTPNIIIDIFYNDNICPDKKEGNTLDEIGSCYSNVYDTVVDSITGLISPNEGLENSPPVDCSSIDSDYTSDKGVKKNYCLINECNFSNSKCVPSPSCDNNNSNKESKTHALGNYASVAGEMILNIIEIQVGFHAAEKAISKVDELLLKKVLTTIADKIMLEAFLDALDPLGWVGMALDFGDPCHYQAYISNTDIKNNFRDPIDSKLTDPSKPLFFQLFKLRALEKSTDKTALPFQILYRAYVSWTTFVNAGINEIALKGGNLTTEAATRAADATVDNNYCSFIKLYDAEYDTSHKDLENIYYSNSDVINQINTDEPSSLTTTSTDPTELKQIQLWKYIYRYCKNGGVYTINSGSDKKLVLYNGEPTDGKGNLPNLWDNSVDGMPKLSSYIISTDTLNKIKDMGQNGSVVTLSLVGARALQNLLNSEVTYGRVCGNAKDPSDSCILDDLVFSISNKYRDYSNCDVDDNGNISNKPCRVAYMSLPEELPLYYPSSNFVNTLCRYSTRGMKWISERYTHFSPSDGRIMNVLNGANESVDNSSPDALGKNYYDEETGLCNFNYNYCDSKACRDLYCYSDEDGNSDKISSPDSCKIVAENEKYVDCENSWEYDAASFFIGDTLTCGAIHLFEKGDLECPPPDSS